MHSGINGKAVNQLLDGKVVCVTAIETNLTGVFCFRGAEG